MAGISDVNKVSSLVVVLTEAAQGAGLSEERAKAIYSELIEHYRMMNDAFAGELLKEVQLVVNL
jgi:hypothetical protein